MNNMKNIYIAIAGFVLGFVICFLIFNANRIMIPTMHAQGLSSAGGATVILGKVAGVDAAVIYDSQTKRLLIYKLLAGQIIFWTSRNLETDIQCESFGTTSPTFDNVKKTCKLEDKK